MGRMIYNDTDNESYFYCEWSHDRSRWEWIEKFDNRDELKRFLAVHKNTILDTLNFSGNDTYSDGWMDSEWTYHPGTQHFRNRIFLNNAGKIIDIRPLLPSIQPDSTVCRYSFLRAKKPEYIQTYAFRKDPVPRTGRRIHRYTGLRRWKNWKRNLLIDSIPEYEEYIRRKAMQPDKWRAEPFRDTDKSWKSQTRCRKQWEIHLPKKAQS